MESDEGPVRSRAAPAGGGPSRVSGGAAPPSGGEGGSPLPAGTYEESPEFLEGVVPELPDEPPDEPPSPPLEGRRIGSWELVREIGRGGMGIVWEARRADEQYEQRAAVKLLPGGLLSQSDIVRFRHERQILARLDHRASGACWTAARWTTARLTW